MNAILIAHVKYFERLEINSGARDALKYWQSFDTILIAHVEYFERLEIHS